MYPLTIEQIRQVTGALWYCRGRDVPVEGICTDSRQAKPGEIFVALRGEKCDGHDYLQHATDAGCISAIIDKQAGADGLLKEYCGKFGAGVLEVPDTVKAISQIASHIREKMLATTVIGITGSNGKTTVKRMVDHILSKRFKGFASPKSFNNHIGVPITIFGANPTDDYVVCEIGSNAPGEIASLSKIVLPNIAVITSVGMSHLEKLKSVEEVAREKASILNWVTDDGLAIVNGDNEYLRKLFRIAPGKIVSFGLHDECNLRLTDYKPNGHGCEFTINGRFKVSLGIPGRHNAINAIGAIAVASRMGMDLERACGELADFEGVKMRMERKALGEMVIINDAYNANPLSMKAALEVLEDTTSQGRKVFIAADMLELGVQGPELHEMIGAHAARHCHVDLLITVGQLGRYIAKGARAGKMQNVAEFDSTDQLAQNVKSLLQPNDTVMLKGSRGMKLEKIVETLLS